MKRDEVITRLKDAEAELRARGVAHAALFGSVARGWAKPGSDIDIMVDIEPGRELGLFEYASLVSVFEDMFDVPVDVSNRRQLKPHVRPSAEPDAVYAF